MSQSVSDHEPRLVPRKSTPGRLAVTASILVVAVGGSLVVAHLFGWSGFLAWMVWLVFVIAALATDVWVGRKYWGEPRRYWHGQDRPDRAR